MTRAPMRISSATRSVPSRGSATWTRSSETGGPRTRNSSHRRSAPGRRVALPCSHFFRVGDELIKCFAPSLIEAHLFVSFAAGLVPVHGESRIFCPASLRLERDDRRKDDRRTG